MQMATRRRNMEHALYSEMVRSFRGMRGSEENTKIGINVWPNFPDSAYVIEARDDHVNQFIVDGKKCKVAEGRLKFKKGTVLNESVLYWANPDGEGDFIAYELPGEKERESFFEVRDVSGRKRPVVNKIGIRYGIDNRERDNRRFEKKGPVYILLPDSRGNYYTSKFLRDDFERYNAVVIKERDLKWIAECLLETENKPYVEVQKEEKDSSFRTIEDFIKDN